jgi:hypothetical protein
MSRPYGARGAMALLLALAAGCQDYNFNPVGHCVLQPSSERVTLSSVATADVLFVVDDSGSMGAEQQLLAGAFTSFINNLDQANAARVAAGLEPFEFHLAVTSTSVFWNYTTSTVCSSTCPGAAGSLVCCAGSAPRKGPKACSSNADCASPSTCNTQCNGLKGESYCCDPGTHVPPLTQVIPCSREGAECGTFERHFNFAGCGSGPAGTAVDQWPYPQGDFVSWTSGTSANPRVLHFDKKLYSSGTNVQGFTRQDLVSFFAGGVAQGRTVQGNVITGTCGSGEEQGFSAARLALEKAIANQQKDTYDLAGAAKWDSANRVATAAADWLHPNSKLVLVFVGDEDDCSAPADPAGGVVMQGLDVPGSDSCTRDAATGAPVGQKLYDVVTRFVDYFTSLGRPVGAAFIESAAQTSCSGDQCTPGTCCQANCPSQGLCGHDSQCGGQAPATRFFRAAGELRGRGADVVVGSICDPDFGTLLSQIAEIVKPPSGLSLPTQPAESAITLLRIADTSGKTRKLCGRPEPVGAATLAAAQAAVDANGNRYDWWFTATRDPGPPVPVSQHVYINPQGRCIANPGETYSADYLGLVPAGGCQTDADCVQKLGGNSGAWTCFAGMSGNVCQTPTQAQPGTCICGPRSQNCG